MTQKERLCLFVAKELTSQKTYDKAIEFCNSKNAELISNSAISTLGWRITQYLMKYDLATEKM